MKKTYGVTLKERTGSQKPVTMTVSDNEKSRIVLDEAKKVIKMHTKVIKALANRQIVFQ